MTQYDKQEMNNIGNWCRLARFFLVLLVLLASVGRTRVCGFGSVHKDYKRASLWLAGSCVADAAVVVW